MKTSLFFAGAHRGKAKSSHGHPPAGATWTVNPLRELRDNLGDFASRCRSMRWLGALFRVGVAQDIVSDVEAQHREVTRLAHHAGVHAEEALAELAAAQREGSEGGKLITPSEARRIKRKLEVAAADDRKICEVTG